MTESKLVRIRDLQTLVGMKKSSIYKLMKSGEFPRPVKISERCVAWKVDDLNDWIASLPTGGSFAPGCNNPGGGQQ